MRLTLRDLAQLGLTPEVDQVFETDLLEVRRARFRVVRIDPRGAEVTWIEWTADTAASARRP